jgi:hypothetical protein
MGMRRRRAVAIVTLVSGVCTASLSSSCGMFSAFSGSEPTSSSGADATDDASASGDGAGESDSNASDGTGVADVSSGGADAADATTNGPYCASISPPPRYCADYDKPDASPTNPFTHAPGGGAASIKIDSVHSVSAPSEITFFTSAGAADNTDGRTAAEFIGQPQITHTAHFGFSVYLDAASDPSTTLVLAAIGFGGAGAPAYNVALVVGGGQAPYISEQYNGVEMHTTALLKAPLIGAWSRVDFMLDFDARAGVVTVDGTNTPLVMHSPVIGAVGLMYGVNYFNNGQAVIATTARFDNVVYDGS